MSNSVFVARDDTFDITIYYSKEGKFEVLSEDEVESGEKKKEDYLTLTVTFRVPDYQTSRMVMRESVTYDNAPGGTINYSLFNIAVFTYMAKGWDAKDENGEEIPFDFEKLNQLRPDIALKFIELLVTYLRENGLYDSLVLS